MSIQPFAQSLLSDVRKRREEEERRLRKQRERQELMGLGLGLAVKIGNETLANKTSNFLQNEQVWNANQTQKLARKNAASFYNIQSSVDASGGDARSWAAKNMMPEFQARAEEILADEYTGAAGPYQELVRSKVDELADQWAKDYEEALQLSSRIASEDDYNSMVVLNAKKARPNDINSYVSRGIINLFGGRSQDDIRQEAVTAITEGRMAENAEKLNDFMAQYKKTGDLVRAFDYANLIHPDTVISDDEKYKILSKEDKLDRVGDKTFIYTETKRREINTGFEDTDITIKTTQDGKPEILFQTTDSPEKIALDTAKALNSIFSFNKDAKNILRPEVYARFAEEVFNAENGSLNIVAPSSIEEYNKISAIYRTYLTLPSNLQNEFRNQKTLRAYDLITGDPEEIQALIASFEDDPEKQREAIDRLERSIFSRFQAAETLQLGPLDYRIISKDDDDD